MTILETILIASLWIIVGVWICHKRDWYKGDRFKEFNPGDERIYRCIMCIIVSPISLLTALFTEFVIRDWHN